ncbi:MAG: TraR/DksA family transcriptional regulator [Thermoanaerobaculia bacterium]
MAKPAKPSKPAKVATPKVVKTGAKKGGGATSSTPAAAAPVAAAPAPPLPPIKSFPARPQAKSKAASLRMPVVRRLGREMQRVGDARDATPPTSRPAFPKDFLARQRQRLLDKKAEILAMYRKDLQSGQESNDSPTEDIVDRANNAYSRELAFSISDNEREFIFQIDQAIARMDAGTYGYCLHTGQPIGIARLEALPWAKYGVEAQELLEKGLLSEA